jgi:hypothetical protein
MPPADRLIAAAQAGQVAEVRALVTADPGLLTARSMFGAGAVHAAHYGDGSSRRRGFRPAFRWRRAAVASASLTGGG